MHARHYVCPGLRPEVSRLYHWFVLFSLILAAAWLGSRYSSDVNDEAYGQKRLKQQQRHLMIFMVI